MVDLPGTLCDIGTGNEVFPVRLGEATWRAYIGPKGLLDGLGALG